MQYQGSNDEFGRIMSANEVKTNFPELLFKFYEENIVYTDGLVGRIGKYFFLIFDFLLDKSNIFLLKFFFDFSDSWSNACAQRKGLLQLQSSCAVELGF